LREDHLEELVWKQVIQLLQEPELIHQEIERRRQLGRRLNPAHQRGDAVTAELARVQRSMNKLLDAYQADLMGLDDLRPG
jgi:site-specific DNA recombinase